MATPYCERAIDDALKHGNALLKFISRNNVGLTGSHESGFYLPKAAWELFTPHPPVVGTNEKHPVRITWQDGRVTESVVTWYGQGTRSEYRLTRFGRDFPFLNEGVVGDMLVLIGVPNGSDAPSEFLAYVLDLDDDIDEMQAALGVDAFGQWGIYKHGAPVTPESESLCLERLIREFAALHTAFPRNEVFSDQTRVVTQQCVQGFAGLSPDQKLVRWYRTEYQIFQAVERQVCGRDVSGRLFRDIDDFLAAAASIMNRRKSRAGRSLENHVDTLLRQAAVPHEMRPDLGGDGTPDIIVPSAEAYKDGGYPPDRILIVGLKTTCKDRWRQVTQEGPRIRQKYLITLQEGISTNQLAQMSAANVSLVVPKPLHQYYPEGGQHLPLTVQSFIDHARRITS